MFEWFENNLLKGNADRCHLLVTSSDAINLTISKYDIKNCEYEKLMDVKFANKLSFRKILLTFVEKQVRRLKH